MQFHFDATGLFGRERVALFGVDKVFIFPATDDAPIFRGSHVKIRFGGLPYERFLRPDGARLPPRRDRPGRQDPVVFRRDDFGKFITGAENYVFRLNMDAIFRQQRRAAPVAIDFDDIVGGMKASAALDGLSKIPRRQFNGVGFGISVIEQRRRSIDPKVVSQRPSIQVLAGEPNALSLCDLARKPRSIKDVAGQAQGRAGFKMGMDTQPIGARAKFIHGISRGDPHLLRFAPANGGAQSSERGVKFELQQSGASRG